MEANLMLTYLTILPFLSHIVDAAGAQGLKLELEGVRPACMPDHVCLFCNFVNGVLGHERNLSAAVNFEKG